MDRRSGLALALAATLLVAGCASQTSAPGGSAAVPASAAPGESAGGGGTLVIGYAAGLTGALAPYDGPASKGIQLAVDKINAKGGIDGRWKIDLRVQDMRSDPAQGAVVAQSLIDGGAQLLITPCDADPSVAVGQIAQKAKIPAISSCASTPTLPSAVGDDMFMASMGDNAQATVEADYAIEQGYRTAYLLGSPDAAYTQKIPEYFKQVFTAKGGSIIGEGTFKLGAQDFSAEVTKIKNLSPQPDVIQTSAWIPDAPTFIKQLRAAGVQTPVIGADALDSPELISAGGASVEGVVFSTHGFPTPGSPLETFYQDYQAKFGQPADTVFIGVGADAIAIIEAAVTQAGSIDPATVRDAIDNLQDVQGFTGPITFKGQSRIPLKQVSLVTVKDGKLALVRQVVPAATEVPAP